MGEKLTGKWATYVGLEKIGRLSTIDENGMPHTTPVFYVLMDGEIYVGTQRGRKKFRNLQRNLNVCFTIDTPALPYKGIVIQGKAEVMNDEALHARFREALIHRYYGAPDNPGWQYVQSLGQSALIKIHAEKIFNWDFSGA
ncbi:MAG: pyridoxamine 5'-phosphate oxidase family protein [Blastocatellia bacterium]